MLLWAVLIAAATVWAKAPEWVERGRSATYSDAQYMQGIGVAASRGDVERDRMRAEDGARAEIAREIRVQVASVVEDELSDRGGEVFSATTVVTRSSVDVLLEGVRIAERWHDKKKDVYYALAVLDRMEAGRRLTRQMAEANRVARAYWEGAEADRSEGRWLSALRGVFRTEEERYRALSLERIRSVVWKGFERAFEEEAPEPLSIAEMERTAERMVSGMMLRVASGDGQQATWGEALERPLVVEAIWRIDRRERPVQGLPVSFGFERGTGALDSAKVTDEQGKAVCKVHRISGDRETAMVVARVDTASLGGGFTNPYTASWLAQLAGTRAVFALQGALRRLFVKVEETMLGEATGEHVVESLLRERISEWGNVAVVEEVESADWILEGRAQVRAGQSMGGIHSCYATVTVRLVEVRGQTELFKKRIDGIKGFHLDQREAARRALGKAGAQIAEEVVAVLRGL